MGYIGQNQGGDNSIRDFAQQNSSTYSSRFLADDTGIYNFEQNTAPGGFDDLAARGQYAPPITAPENFWANAF
jgi:hypothetical protein